MISAHSRLRPFSFGGTVAAVMAAAALGVGGCASKPSLTQTGFLSDYSELKPVNDSRMRYQSPRAGEYSKYIIEPVVVTVQGDVLPPAERAEAIKYFNTKLLEVVKANGFTVVTEPGPGVARLRVAITSVAKSTWWQKVHPASRIAGAGTGGAAMEGELVDSVTGEQIGAVIQAGTGNQFDFTAFSTLADVKSAIDGWSEHFAARLKDLREAKSR